MDHDAIRHEDRTTVEARGAAPRGQYADATISRLRKLSTT
jgi:hypothetical protein